MNSHLITYIQSALQHLDLNGREVLDDTTNAVLMLKITLRNWKVQLLCLGNGEHLIISSSLFSSIKDAIESILAQKIPFDIESDDSTFSEWVNREILTDISSIETQLADEWKTCRLAVEEVVGIADSVLENVADFLVYMHGYIGGLVSEFVEVDVFDAIEAHLTFLKGLLVFAKGTGAELQQLLIDIQPFAISAARVFIKEQHDDDYSDDDYDAYVDKWYRDWYEEIHSKCSKVIGIATTFEIYQAYTRALSTSTFSSQYAGMDDDDDDALYISTIFLNSIISFLWDVLRHHPDSRIKDQLKVLYGRLRFCRAILKRQNKDSVWNTRDQIGALICGAAMLVCSLHHPHVEVSYPDQLSELLERFGVYQIKFGNKTSESADEMGPGDSAYIMEDMMISDGNEETAMSIHQPGFQDDEVNSILDRLTRGPKQLQTVPIYGMPGLGKTTFASTLYDSPSIIYHFQARAWCAISQVLDMRKVLLQLMSHLIPKAGSFSKMTENDLANKLRQSLKGKRYLIVLDDVWTTEAWDSLAASFPDDSTQSRVILTSQHHDIVPHAMPYLLRLREDNECLEIVQRHLSHRKGWTIDLGMTVAKMCKGLPLTVVVVAGLLRTTKQKGWKGILDYLISSGVSGEKQCSNVLELSFKHLPNDLKLCLLYFAAFPEDEEIYVKRLLRLWMGEGLVRENESTRVEDVAGEYLQKLIQRSLVTVVRNRSIGGVKTCRIHDLIHDFCLKKANQENFFHILSQKDDELLDFNEPFIRRLSIHSDPIHFKEARLFCSGAHSILFSTTQSYHESYLFDMLFIIQIFKLLHVLDISMISFSTGIPSEIELLTRLRYLSIRSSMSVIPSSLGNLPNLETLIGYFWSDEVMSFPHTLWNLDKLKWLHITSARCLDGFTLPMGNLEKSSTLFELEALCTVAFYSYGSIEQQLRKFPNIRRLKCSILHGTESMVNSNKILISDILNQLRCLTISGEGPLLCEFGSSESLRRLSLRGFELSREEIADIGKLPNLEVLKLQNISFCGDALDMEEGEFSKLKSLNLIDIDIKRWTVSDEQLPCLKKLSLFYCKVSEELPCECLTHSATLEEIEVFDCSDNVENFARGVEEFQKEHGNFVKVHITRVEDEAEDDSREEMVEG